MRPASPGKVRRPPAGWRPQPALGHYFPAMAELCLQVDPELRRLEVLLDGAEAVGRDTSFLRQALGEVRWRLQYTGDLAAADAALARLRAAAALPDPPSGLVPDEDGSYGAGTHVWFLKLDASVDSMLAADFAGGPPPRFLDRVNHPDRLGHYLDSLVVSRLAEDGVDRRKELNFATADLVRLILRRRPPGYRWDPRLETVIRHFLARWQDPATGFFGADYEIAGERWRTTDLSMTFHMARYLEGRIGHWPQLIDTLIEIREDRYPNGWLDDNGLTNHNNYDVAVLFQLGWPKCARISASARKARSLACCRGAWRPRSPRMAPLRRARLANHCPRAITSPQPFSIRWAFSIRRSAFGPIVGFPDAPALRTLLERQIRKLPPGDRWPAWRSTAYAAVDRPVKLGRHVRPQSPI